jgi:methylated-DNA-[protein]-cysteine S-methyltransferase
MSHTLSRLPSPLGDLLAVTAADGTLHALDFADFDARLPPPASDADTR